MPHLTRPRHVGKAMYFSCIDDYFTVYNNRRREELGQPFGPALAGGGLSFLLDGTQTAACMQIATGCVISGTSDVYLVSHIDCGAYRYFGGVNWLLYDEEVQIATLWRDLHAAETVARDFLKNFDHPFDSTWKLPPITFHLEVVDLNEQSVAEPTSLSPALSFDHYHGVRVPHQYL